ncbi:MAG: hypothetical protein IJ078_05855 [Succinivibrionaceae bacterium]|nr:hypothetical protein [Succinivibrionaceae bacterium]
MIKDVEFSENIENFRAPGFPSYDEIIEYEARGEGKKNALEYEKAYIALIEQVKDKPREEQVKFLLEHIDELRRMIDLFSFCRDQEMFPEGETYDEVLANVMLYRYEHNISILDDEYSIKTIDYARSVKSRISSERGRKKAEAENKFAKEHLEEYKAILEKRHQEAIRLGGKIAETGKKLRKEYAEYTLEELISGKIRNN